MDGYAHFKIDGKVVRGHRYLYLLLKGSIPHGMELDHECRNRKCVNPDHLKPMTHRENVLRGNGVMVKFARQTHCKRGHPLCGDNLEIVNTGRGRRGRRCLMCFGEYQIKKRGN